MSGPAYLDGNHANGRSRQGLPRAGHQSFVHLDSCCRRSARVQWIVPLCGRCWSTCRSTRRWPRPPSPSHVARGGKETVRRWVVQAQIDGGQRQGATGGELAEIKDLMAKVRRLEEDNEILRRATTFFAGELDHRDR